MKVHDAIKNQLYQIALHGKRGEFEAAKDIIEQTEQQNILTQWIKK